MEIRLRLTFSLKQTNGKAELVVKDNGKGFAEMSPMISDGHGMRIMNYRAQVIGAAFQVGVKTKQGHYGAM